MTGAMEELKKSIALALTNHHPVNSRWVQKVHFFGALLHTHTHAYYIVPLITCIDKHSAFNQAFQSDEYSIISIYEGKTSNRIQAHKNN